MMENTQILAGLQKLSAAAILDVLDGQGYRNVQMAGVHSLLHGQKMVGRAITVRFLPTRPDLKARIIGGVESAE